DYVARPKAGPPRVVFIGTKHAGNEDALKHFIADIWPLVRAERPDSEFWVAGSIGAMLSAQEASKPGVRVLGRVNDLGELGGSQSIGIAPTRLATGVSIKLAEYLVLGMPSVAYPLALEGFGAALDDLVRTTNSPEGFAAELITLLTVESARLEMAGRAGDEVRERLSNMPAAQLMSEAARTLRTKVTPR
ncbi:MAG: glycosyltransferase family 4 protein, partial [Hyphomonas sp.]